MITLLSSSRHGRAPRGVGAWLFALAVVVLGLVGFSPSVVHADNTVVNSSPSTGAVLDVAPDAIVIGFAEPLGEDNTIALDCEAEPVTLPQPEVVDGTTLQVEIAAAIPSGTCTARWGVSNTDGEPNGRGVITFVVENAAPEGGVDPDAGTTDPTATTSPPTAADADAAAETDEATEEPDEPPSPDELVIDFSEVEDGDATLGLFQFLSTLGIAVLFGSLVVITAAWPEGVEYLVTIKFLRLVWIVSMIVTVVFAGLAAAAVTPEGGGGPFSPGSWPDLFDAGWSGRAILLRVVLLAAAAWPAFRPERVIDPTTQLAALGVAGLCTATLGITRTTGDWVALGVVMGVLHALAMAVWVGGVVLLARVVLSGPGEEDLVHAVRGFGRVSIPAIIVTIATGLVQMFRLDGGALFQSGHGRVLVLKTVVVAVMIFVAFSARQFVTQRLNRAQQMSVPLADRLRRAFGAEAAIGVVVLGLSAWLLALTPPNVEPASLIVYEVSQTHTDEAGTLDVRVRLTDSQIGLVGLEVEVIQPDENLSGLAVVLSAPPNDQNLEAIRQPIPLTEPGFAVRDESVGLPISVAGDWTIQVIANTASGPVESTPQIFTVTDETGGTATSEVTVPPSSAAPVTEVASTEG